MNQKPLILAVETSSRIGSVAIAIGKKILEETTFSAPLRHSAEIFPAINTLLNRFSRKPSQIEQVHISIGPGSFTGLRIAATLAKTLHLANNVKIVTADTLDVIAENAIQTTTHEKIATITDAKRGRFFIAAYKRNTSDGIWQKVLTDSLMTASQFLDQFAHSQKSIWLLGDGLLYYKDKFKAEGVHFFDKEYWSPNASNVLLLCWKKALAGQFADPLTLTPNYLLRPEIKIKTR